ncbi:MAG: hypothetical protein KGH63_01780 [Candidatus Micrarchaeota archaeon]|nr:hypothetical protein [Candidatus Micrarchaeota archaeon]
MSTAQSRLHRQSPDSSASPAPGRATVPAFRPGADRTAKSAAPLFKDTKEAKSILPPVGPNTLRELIDENFPDPAGEQASPISDHPTRPDARMRADLAARARFLICRIEGELASPVRQNTRRAVQHDDLQLIASRTAQALKSWPAGTLSFENARQYVLSDETAVDSHLRGAIMHRRLDAELKAIKAADPNDWRLRPLGRLRKEALVISRVALIYARCGDEQRVEEGARRLEQIKIGARNLLAACSRPGEMFSD